MTIELTGLRDKVAVVTGAGRMRSIGRCIAVELARAGCDVVVTGSGRPPERFPDDEKRAGWRDIESVAEEIHAVGRRALTAVSDVADERAVEALLQQVLAEFGRVDFVVNNAAASRGNDRVPVVDMPVDEWDKVIRVNVRGTFLMSRAFGRQLISQGAGGAIVNISSIAGKLLPANATAYAASKAAIQALTAGMAREMGPYNVRVNAICPGFIDTSRMDDVPREGRGQNIPLGRVGDGSEIGYMAAFLCSDQGNWITGQSYNVDGGTATQH